MLNVVAIMGRLVADPELRTTPQGTNVLQFPHRLRPQVLHVRASSVRPISLISSLGVRRPSL